MLLFNEDYLKEKKKKDLTNDDYLKIYELIMRTRIFEEKATVWWKKGKMLEAIHSSKGQEAADVASAYAMEKGDLALPAMRSRGVYITRGYSEKRTLLNMFPKATSHNAGHDTSHHSPVPELGILFGSGMIGSSIAIGAGAALALKMQGADRVVLNYFGDGASNRGDFHEAINMAAVWKLPCVFILEENGVSISTPREQITVCENLAERALGYGIPGYRVDGNDVAEVYKRTFEAIERARAGEGPTLLNLVVTRLEPHQAAVPEVRSKEHMEQLRTKDPVPRYRAWLIENGIATEEQLDEINSQIEQRVESAYDEVKDLPGPTYEMMLRNVYCEEVQ